MKRITEIASVIIKLLIVKTRVIIEIKQNTIERFKRPFARADTLLEIIVIDFRVCDCSIVRFVRGGGVHW